MHVEFVEGHLRQFFEVDGNLAGLGVRQDRADQLGVDAEAIDDQEQAVLVSGLRFADVERARERAGQRGSVQRGGADLGAVGAGRRRLGAEVRLRRPCRRSGRRRRPG